MKPLSEDAVREAIETQVCPWCGEGPFRSLAGHTFRKHEVSADDLREWADLPASRPTCSSESSELYADVARDRESSLSALEKVRQERAEEIAVWIAEAQRERARRAREQTHCTRGHEFTPENTAIRRDGSRRCVTCQRDVWSVHSYARKKLKRREEGAKPRQRPVYHSCGCRDSCLIGPEDKRHGTLNGYKNFKCRCGACSMSNTEFMRDRRREVASSTVCPDCSGPGGLYAEHRCRSCHERSSLQTSR